MKQIADAISKDGNKETTPDTTVKISNIENLNPKRKPKSFIRTKPTITRMVRICPLGSAHHNLPINQRPYL
jgi:hypothetical protein